MRYLIVDEDSSGQRLDNYLMREIKGVPRTRLYRALRKGEIRVNKGRVKADYRLVAGDRCVYHRCASPSLPSRRPFPRYWSEQLSNRLVYEDGSLLVINKPSGLAVHGGSGLSFGLIECLRQMRPDDRYLELVHRLDRDTSGLILIARRAGNFARTASAAARKACRQALPGPGGRASGQRTCGWSMRRWKKT